MKYLEEAAGSGMYSLFELADKLLPEVLASSHIAVLAVHIPCLSCCAASSTNGISTGHKLLLEVGSHRMHLPLLKSAADRIAEHTACCTVVREKCGAVIVGRHSFQPYADCAGKDRACKGCEKLLTAVLSRRRSSGNGFLQAFLFSGQT